MQTHETYIAAVAEAAKLRLSEEERAKLAGVKLVYGAGPSGTRGITYYDKWHANGHDSAAPFCEICAFCESDDTQLAGTTVHELGHVLAGFEAGHGKAWKDACSRLGLRRALAAGQSYSLAAFTPDLRFAIASLAKPEDGTPQSLAAVLGAGWKPKPCTAGIGTRGGKSRGAGSGSRLVKVACSDCGYTARVSRKWLDVGAPHCPQHGEMEE